MSLSQVFSYEALVHAISGTVGGSCAMTLFYPLDNIRTFLQIDNTNRSSLEILLSLVKKEGLKSLYRGLVPVLISLGFSNFVYFYSNNMLKVMFKKLTGEKNISIALNLLVASIAGVINVLTTCPLWVANTRLKIQKDKDKKIGLFEMVKKIAEEEGILALWNGCLASLVLVSNPTINFVVYDKVKQIAMESALKGGRKHLTSLEIFVIGAIAKAVATVLTYPIQLAQSRMRAMKGGHSHGGGHTKMTDNKNNKDTTTDKKDKNSQESRPLPETYNGTLHCLYVIFKRDGFFGWFRGIYVKLLQTVLTAAFQFMAYENIARFIFTLFKADTSKIKVSE